MYIEKIFLKLAKWLLIVLICAVKEENKLSKKNGEFGVHIC